ncbi:MAG: hypothetical protein AAB019_01850 [Planctomycetota bacterium]
MEFDTSKTYKLGEILKKASLITEDQLKTALGYQQSTGERLGEIIEKLGYIKEEVLTSFIAEQQGIEIIDLDNVVLPLNLIRKIPRTLIEKYNFLPIGLKDDVLNIVISDPTDYEAIEEIQLATNWRVNVLLAPRGAIKKQIAEIFQKKSKKLKSKEELLNVIEGRTIGRKDKTDISADDGLLIRALRDVLVSKKIITEEELAEWIKKLQNSK